MCITSPKLDAIDCKEFVDKDLTCPLKLPDGGAVVFGRNPAPRKRCRRPKASEPEKSLVLSDEAVHDTSTERSPLDLLCSDDQQCPEPADDYTVQALVPTSSSPGNETQQSGSFEEDCRAIAAALAQRHDKHEMTIDLDVLLEEGRAIYNCHRHQAQKLQKQKILVDEMSMLLASTSESSQQS